MFKIQLILLYTTDNRYTRRVHHRKSFVFGLFRNVNNQHKHRDDGRFQSLIFHLHNNGISQFQMFDTPQKLQSLEPRGVV